MGSIYWFAIGVVATVFTLWLARKVVRAIRHAIGGEDFEAECQRRYFEHEWSAD